MVAGVEALATLAAAGFDIAHAFDAAAAAREPGLDLLAGEPRLGLLLGNTRALWPPFREAMRDPALAAQRDPLERYTERTVDAAFPGARIYYGHRPYGGAFLPLQRLAVATGLGALAPTHLVIHPVYGPWFALRAVVVLDGDPPARAPIAPPCRCDASCGEALSRAQQSMDWRDWLAVRESCSLQNWRYGEDQIRYHYVNGLAARSRG
jgi:cyanocobalamin reductase (cyanide-eliminating) / alkylcobalamin dealkylase